MPQEPRELLCIRVGDAGEYETFDTLDAAIDYLNDLQVGQVTNWFLGPWAFGFETPNYWEVDYIVCYWGTTNQNFTRPLNTAEKTLIETRLKMAFI
jgi:hypothetical protein